jgi:polysaccharide biosynthesis transport protein
MPLDADIGTPAARPPEQALGPYFRALRRNWLLVVAITLLTGVVAAATTLRGTPTYQASATVLVSPLEQGDANFVNTGVVLDTGEPVRTVQTAAALINSLPAAQKTAAAIGHGWTAAEVQSSIGVTPRGESNVLEVTAQASTPAQAAKLANRFAQEAVAYRGTVVQGNISAQLEDLEARLNQVSGTGIADSNLVGQLSTRIAALRAVQAGGGDPTLQVTGLATPGGSPTGAPRWLIILLSLIGGFAIGSVAALAVDFFNRSVGDVDEVEGMFSVPVLATVPKVGNGRGNVLRPSAFSPIAFEQVRMLKVLLSNRERAPVIMLTSPGPSDGKTTLAAALAAAFAESGEEVILLDLDLRKPDIAPLLGLKPRRAVDLVDAPLEELLIEVPGLPGVRVLAAPQGDPSLFPLLLARLPKLLDEAEGQARHVIIDAAPVGFASETLQIARICDQVVVVVRARHTDRQRAVQARDLLAQARAPVVGVVLTQSASNAYTYGYGYAYGAPAYEPSDERPDERSPLTPALPRHPTGAKSA